MPSQSHASQPVSASLIQLWQWLTTPAAELQDFESRRQARLLSTLLILQITLTIPTITFLLLAQARTEDIFASFVIGICVILMVVAYGLSRTRHYMVGAMLYVGAIMGAVFVITLVSPGSSADRSIKFLGLAVLLSGILLSVTATSVVTAISVVGIALVPIVNHAVSFGDVVNPMAFVIITAALVLVTAVLRRSDQAHIKRQSQSLAESEERYRTLLDATSEAILLHEDGAILDVNHAFETLFACPASGAAIGRAILDFVDRESHNLIIQSYQDDILTPEEILCKRWNGSLFQGEILTKTHLYKGRPVRVVSIRDITDRERTERQKLELAVERERVAVLQKFISDASHDLRTPLTNIKTSLYLIKRLSHDPEKQKQHLGGIETQANRLERLFTDLLMLSRLDKAATAEFKFGITDVNEMVDEVVVRLSEMAQMKGHIVTFTPNYELPMVRADKLRLAMAVANVIVNAFSYTPDGGKIDIRALRRDKWVVIEIQDNGIGIDQENLAQIFESFYRVDDSRNTHTGGAGLGLSIAKRVVGAHRGAIEVESTPNVGSTFRLLLPGVPDEH